MQINHKISYILIGTILLGFLLGGWFFYQQLFQGIKDPMKVIPQDAAIILEIPEFEKFYKNWHTGTAYEKALLEWPGLGPLQYGLPQMIPALKEWTSSFEEWEAVPVIFSLHQEGVLVLFASNGTGLQSLEREVISQFSPLPEMAEKTIENQYYLELISPDGELYISEKRGLFFMSTSISLLSKALQNINKFNAFSDSQAFLALQKVSGKRSDAHVYVNYQELGLLFAQDSIPKNSSIWAQAQQIGLWSGLDLNLKNNEILLNGYSIAQDTTHQFLTLLKDQNSLGMTIVSQFPYETKSYYHLSLNQYGAYLNHWKNYLNESGKWDTYAKYFEKIEKSIKGKPEEIHPKWWAGEMASVKTEDGKDYGIFLAHKGRESFKTLSEIAHLSQPSMISMDYKGVKMKEINFPYFLRCQFGPWFESLEKTYFTVVDELVIFAKSISDLKAYIDLLESGYILQKNESYHSFSDNLSKNTSFSFYVNRPESAELILDIFPKADLDMINKTSLFQKDLNGFSLQLNWKNQMVYTGIFAGLSGKTTQKSSSWQIQLDSQISKGPFQVTDHTDGSHKYIVFDEFRQMYLINEQGDVMWKKQLEEKAKSDVFEIDFYKNGKIQYLFNTENYLYLIDLTGQLVTGYPVKLNSEASAGLALFDYTNNKDYRILIPCVNGEIYNYKIDGSLLKDWKSKNTRRTIPKPISQVVANSSDYIIAEADNGNILMFDRKGKVRLEIRKSFVNALGSNVYANRTNSKGMMITTNSEGKLIYIPEKGKVRSSDFGDFSKDHFFIYNDFTGNGNYDFIYLDGSKLQVFDRLKKPILTYVFENPIQDKPKIFTLSGRKILAVLDDISGQLFLFNSDGLIPHNLHGNSDYIIDISKSGNAFVLIGKDKSLMKYPLR